MGWLPPPHHVNEFGLRVWESYKVPSEAGVCDLLSVMDCFNNPDPLRVFLSDSDKEYTLTKKINYTETQI